jgi:competence protein ComEC
VTRYPLLPITIAFSAGIAAAPYFYLQAWEQLVLLLFVLSFSTLLVASGRPARGFYVSLGGFFLCGTFLAAAEHHVLPPGHVKQLAAQGLFDPGQPAQLAGWVRSPSVKRHFGESFDLELSEVGQAGRTLPARGAARVYYYPRPSDPRSLGLRYGSRLELSLRGLRRPRNFGNPGSFDYEAYMQRRGIAFTAVVRSAEVIPLPGREGSRLAGAVLSLRTRLLDYIDQRLPAVPDGANQGAILKAILLGDDSDLDLDTQSAFQASGTYHVLVVSGLHVTALAAALFWLLALLRVPNPWSTLIVAGAVAGFAALAGSGTPVVRAALMILLFLAARLVYRERALLNAIAAAALVLLVLHPSDLHDPSFQLSFLAVLVLAAVALPVLQWTISPYRAALRNLEDRERDRTLEPRQVQFRIDVRTLLDYLCDPARLVQRRWRWLRFLLRATISAKLAVWEAIVFLVFMQAGFALVMASYFHRVSWAGIVSNLLLFPLTAVLIPGGFLVLVVSLVSGSVATLGGGVLGILVSVLQWTAAWTAGLTWLTRRVPTPPLWLTVCFLALLVCLAILADRRSRWTWAGTCGLFVLCALLTFAPFAPVLQPGQLEVTVLDVGQGDALFVAFPDGQTMLVDAGEGPSLNESLQPVGQDLGESVVSAYLWSRRIQSLDIVVATHAHWDHIGGMRSVLRNFRVGEVWLGPGGDNRLRAEFQQSISEQAIPIRRLAGGTTMNLGAVEAEVLWPAADWVPTRNANNDSLVLRLGFGRRHIVLPGDAEGTVERRLLRAGVPLRGEVLKVPHHGSNDSTGSLFLETLAPGFAVISVGPNRQYGHPRPETLDRLRQAGVRTYRTDRDGATTFLTDGNRIEVRMHRNSIRPWPPFRSPEGSLPSDTPR